jgi:hypothetical protein
MFPFFPFGPMMGPLAIMPPFPFFFPFAFGRAAVSAAAGAAGRDRDDAAPAAGGPAGLMSMAMMPAMAPFALGTRLARVVEDAGVVAAQVRESLERDEGPVHVTVGDPDGPLGLAIGLTFMTRRSGPALADAPPAPRIESMVDVTPPS